MPHTSFTLLKYDCDANTSHLMSPLTVAASKWPPKNASNIYEAHLQRLRVQQTLRGQQHKELAVHFR